MKKSPYYFLLALLLFPSICLAEKIQGHACYTYGDNESLVQAEHTAKMLAIRNAIESNTIFIESTSQITDFQLTQDLLRSVSAGQVKGVKVLKRLESGRTLCYTIEGFVDPNEMQAGIRDYLSKNSSDVRLQDNGWIRIIDQLFAELTEEEFYKRFNLGRKPSADTKDRIITRSLHVKILFLKYCKVTSPIKDDEAAEVFLKKLFEDPTYIIWRFQCDYRTKIFVSFFSPGGYEIKTEGEYPRVDQGGSDLKTEMFPGETAFVTFVVPENAKSWKVWVPK